MNSKFSRRIMFLLAPLFLLGAIFWVRDVPLRNTDADLRDAPLRKADDDFRRDMKAWTTNVDTIQVLAINSKAFPQFKDGIWNTSDFLSTIETIRLTRAQSTSPAAETLPLNSRTEPMLFISLDSGTSVGSTQGFYISLKEDRGWMDIYSKNGSNWKDKGYELAPQTCQALKKHLLSLREKNGELVSPT